jgi:hypothetical protein
MTAVDEKEIFCKSEFANSAQLANIAIISIILLSVKWEKFTSFLMQTSKNCVYS